MMILNFGLRDLLYFIGYLQGRLIKIDFNWVDYKYVICLGQEVFDI